MLAALGLVAAVVATALWSGLLLMLTTILHPVYGRLDAPGFAGGLQRFLPVAQRSPTNYGLLAAMVLTPVVALVGLRADPGGAPFVLTATGLALVVAGPVLTSRFAAEPNYAVILAWDAADPPADWRDARGRWLRVNWLRAAATWAALALFVVATWLYLVP
ncbi:DUF1772 domain-containing protein [Actinomycetospora lemnae]|uniref:DUF1772 domain-containing protein n=1 Tax=Actinomycetospora lemnae TaxID=3019891 RepID=A0ABT5SW91_9PSEU|nr:DUF1772 domain-containing protein [Actinomycetospora sp. DW7H6]MDD7967117.1 DUF1772 domain-containing protein [Actinomycetospora sp. DW7H6]